MQIKYIMVRAKISPSYSVDWLEIERPQPLIDSRIESLINDVVNKKIITDTSDAIYDEFKKMCEDWIFNSSLNKLRINLNWRKDIIIGCTQFIDNIYMNGPVQTIAGDYKYHERLRLSSIRNPGDLIPNTALILATPFPQYGMIHPKIDSILEECISKKIPVHIDGAWITCCQGIDFDFNHPAISSVGISLSKGLGLGWNRVGIRWSRDANTDSISIMNDFHMNNRALILIALYFLRNLPRDYLWINHRDRYEKICKDFQLVPTNSIHLALKDSRPVGLSPLIRYLENESNKN
jgi:hypothetical protein